MSTTTEKTLFLYTESNHDPLFFELEGDWTRFEGVYANTGRDEELEQELNDLVYDEDTGEYKVEFIPEPSKDWTYFVRCGVDY